MRVSSPVVGTPRSSTTGNRRFASPGVGARCQGARVLAQESIAGCSGISRRLMLSSAKNSVSRVSRHWPNPGEKRVSSRVAPGSDFQGPGRSAGRPPKTSNDPPHSTYCPTAAFTSAGIFRRSPAVTTTPSYRVYPSQLGLHASAGRSARTHSG